MTQIKILVVLYTYLIHSSTTFVKHFIANGNNAQPSDYSQQGLTAGYGNTTTAVNAVRFQMSSGNIDSGKIKLYGIKDS
jgi:hypothetical protein